MLKTDFLSVYFPFLGKTVHLKCENVLLHICDKVISIIISRYMQYFDVMHIKIKIQCRRIGDDRHIILCPNIVYMIE